MASMLARQTSMMLSNQSMKNLFNKDPTTNLGHLASLRIDDAAMSEARKTTIICTIGPKTKSVESLCALRTAGMNVVRLNFSHGSFEFHKSIVDNTRKSLEVMPSGRTVAIALDTKGPEIRTGQTKGDEEVCAPYSSFLSACGLLLTLAGRLDYPRQGQQDPTDD